MTKLQKTTVISILVVGFSVWMWCLFDIVDEAKKMKVNPPAKSGVQDDKQ
jgi:hypothetical protein